jgi:hypothetical protein
VPRYIIPPEIFTRYIINLEDGTVFDLWRNHFIKPSKSKYIFVSFEGKSYPLHRVIFYYRTGRQPDYVGFRDRNPQNLRGNNLCEAGEAPYTNKKLRRRISTATP